MSPQLWTVSGNTEVRRSRTLPRNVIAPPTVPVPTPASRWPGDPGDKKFNIGWALGPNGNLTIAAAKTNAGYPGDSKISVIHDYSNVSTGIKQSAVNSAISAGFISSQSFKMPSYSPAQILLGNADADIDKDAKFVASKAPWPIWLCYYHEPEDNITTAATQRDYRAAYRRIATRYRAAGVTNVAWMPIYMNPYTFDSGSGRDWRNWHPDWNGAGWYDDILMDMFGADTYNPIPNATLNRTFASMFDTLKSKVELPGYPTWDYVCPEFGMSYDATPTPNWITWATAAREYAQANRIKSFIYWDNSDSIGRWSFGPTYDPTGNKLAAWKIITGAAVKKVTA